jgi:D-alanyl-lipoteichoic acid acyltransferase DltB (MBOAT superfamily)
MLFQTATFLIFFALVLGAYWALQHRLVWQNRLLLAASYLFYGWWDIRFLSLIVGGTALAFLLTPAVAGLRLSRAHLAQGVALAVAGAAISFAPNLATDWPYLALALGLIAAAALTVLFLDRMADAQARARIAMIIGVTALLCLIGVFKYFNFFADSFFRVASLFGGETTWTTRNIVLPIGISFFTFQIIGYLIDVRRGDFPPSASILTFASFVAYFPQLVAGPIERATRLYAQMMRSRTITRQGLTSGGLLFAWGWYKKVVVADNLAPIVNDVFARSSSATPGELAVGILAFAFQIYGDFSGYTDMARGVARMMGFDLMLNFKLPYFSRTPSEFWTRWHISLSSWLRDYLYIGLGGNRGSALLTYRNLFLTMLLGGLWHGAAWTFVAWGAFHGFILILYRLADVDRHWMSVIAQWRQDRPLAHWSAQFGLWAGMFLLTLVGWLFFRAEDMATVGHYLAGFAGGSGWSTGQWGALLLFTLPLVLVQIWQRSTGRLEFLWEAPPFLRFNLLLFLLFSILFLAPSETADFIYFAF